MEDKLLKLLYEDGIITPEQYQQVLEENQRSALSSETILQQMGILSEDRIVEFLSKKFRMPMIDWEAYTVDETLLQLVPESLAVKYTVFPYQIERVKRGGKITLAMADPSDVSAIDDVSFRTGCTVKTAVASARAIHQAIQLYYGGKEMAEFPGGEETSLVPKQFPRTRIEVFDKILARLFSSGEFPEEEADVLSNLDQDHPSTKLLIDLLDTAIEQGISEIHLEPGDQEYQVRSRLRGILRPYSTIPEQVGHGIASRLRRLIQRVEIVPVANKEAPSWIGSFYTSRIRGEHVTILVSLYPTLYGEKILLKLATQSSLKSLEQLGLPELSLKMLHRMLAKSEGLLLLMSPPGHGKTTTLYSILQHCNQSAMQIFTLECPVELVMPGITQISGLMPMTYYEWYSLLAYNAPDLITFGNIDSELMTRLTFEFASSTQVLGSCTAYQVPDGLWALTASLSASIDRPLSHIAPVLFDSINGVVSQRLIRTLCPHCKEEIPASERDSALMQWLTTDEETNHNPVYQAKGCTDCMNTGYNGQTGIFEIIKFDKQVKQFLLQNPSVSSSQWQRFLTEMSSQTLKHQGLQKVRSGVTSLEEIRRVLAQ